MSHLPFSKAANYVSPAKPNTTNVHIQRPRPEPLRTAELQAIPKANVSASGKVLISPVPSQAELQARRKSERLEVASTDVPVRNSTVCGAPYTCPELRTNPHRPGSADAHRPGSADAYRLPSRTGFKTGGIPA